MLRPQDTPTRERKPLTGLWDFRLDAGGTGRDAGWFRAPLEDAVPVPVPASYNDLYPDAAFRDHVGDVWYQRTVRVPRGCAGSGSCSGSTPPRTAPSSGSATAR